MQSAGIANTTIRQKQLPNGIKYSYDKMLQSSLQQLICALGAKAVINTFGNCTTYLLAHEMLSAKLIVHINSWCDSS